MAVAYSLGLFGVFTKITLALQPAFHELVENEKLEMRRAMDELTQTFAAHHYV